MKIKLFANIFNFNINDFESIIIALVLYPIAKMYPLGTATRLGNLHVKLNDPLDSSVLN